jgi:hypothetical protein
MFAERFGGLRTLGRRLCWLRRRKFVRSTFWTLGALWESLGEGR